MIEIEGLTKKFDEMTAVDALDLTVEAGEILGFLGPNGAGKSTTVKMLTCLYQPTSGSARVAGYDVITESDEVKRRIGYVPESGALYETLTANEYLGMIAKIHHLDPTEAEERTYDYFELFKIEHDPLKLLSEYSKGMKQKVLMTAALLSKPEVLFLDEPLNGLDVNAALAVKGIVRQMADQGKTILFCSHILDVVERICSRIVIINNGRIISQGTVEEIRSQTESDSLESAFAKLTGIRDPSQLAQNIADALR